MASSNINRRWARFSRESPTAIEDEVIASAETPDIRPLGTGWQPPLNAANRKETA
jgi:hypothetical protein